MFSRSLWWVKILVEEMSNWIVTGSSLPVLIKTLKMESPYVLVQLLVSQQLKFTQIFIYHLVLHFNNQWGTFQGFWSPGYFMYYILFFCFLQRLLNYIYFKYMYMFETNICRVIYDFDEFLFCFVYQSPHFWWLLMIFDEQNVFLFFFSKDIVIKGFYFLNLTTCILNILVESILSIYYFYQKLLKHWWL